jgi:hypothetical protein
VNHPWLTLFLPDVVPLSGELKIGDLTSAFRALVTETVDNANRMLPSHPPTPTHAQRLQATMARVGTPQLTGLNVVSLCCLVTDQPMCDPCVAVCVCVCACVCVCGGCSERR